MNRLVSLRVFALFLVLPASLLASHDGDKKPEAIKGVPAAAKDGPGAQFLKSRGIEEIAAPYRVGASDPVQSYYTAVEACFRRGMFLLPASDVEALAPHLASLLPGYSVRSVWTLHQPTKGPYARTWDFRDKWAVTPLALEGSHVLCARYKTDRLPNEASNMVAAINLVTKIRRDLVAAAENPGRETALALARAKTELETLGENGSDFVTDWLRRQYPERTPTVAAAPPAATTTPTTPSASSSSSSASTSSSSSSSSPSTIGLGISADGRVGISVGGLVTPFGSTRPQPGFRLP